MACRVQAQWQWPEKKPENIITDEANQAIQGQAEKLGEKEKTQVSLTKSVLRKFGLFNS